MPAVIYICDLERIKMNQHAKGLEQRPFFRSYCADTNIHTADRSLYLGSVHYHYV